MEQLWTFFLFIKLMNLSLIFGPQILSTDKKIKIGYIPK